MDVWQAPTVAVEGVIDLRLRPGHEVLPIVIAQNHPEIDVLQASVGALKFVLEGGIVHRVHSVGIDVIA
jgi:hypothetical protein